MGRFTGVLLTTDYDDTLYDSKGTVSQENRDAIARFQRAGGLFTISTGRSYINFIQQLKREHLPVNAPVILSNGASIYDFAAEESLWLKLLPQEARAHLTELCAVFPELGFEAYHEDQIYVFRPNATTFYHLTRCGLVGERREIGDMPVPWLKVILQHTDTLVLQQAQAYLLKKWPALYEATFSNRFLLELTAKGANKGYSILWLAQHLGVQRENLYCIGNGLNDIPMLSISARSFAPANSYPEVCQAADVVLPSCDESCVARMIEALEKQY